MTIFTNNLYRIFTSKIRLLVIILSPILFMIIFASMDMEAPLKLAVIDEDNTKLSSVIIEGLENNFIMISINNEEAIMPQLIEGKIDYALVIEEGFEEKFMKEEKPQLKGYYINGTNTSIAIEAYLSSTLDVMANIAAIATNKEEFYMGLRSFQEGPLRLNFETANTSSRDRSRLAMGFLVQFSLYMSVLTTGIIPQDKKNRTFFRIFSAPISMKRYMIESVLSFIIIGLLQVLIIFGISKFVMNLYLGESILYMLLLYFVFTVAVIALGLIISNYSKTPTMAYLIIFLITTPLVMLGGCYWPRSYMPEILVKISNFIPTSWVMSAAEKLLHGGNLNTISQELLILGSFTIVFFLIGVLRKVDITK